MSAIRSRNNMLSNNAFERAVGQRGPRLSAAGAPCPAAQLGRYASRDSSRVCASVPGKRWSSGNHRSAIRGNVGVSVISVAGGKVSGSTSFCNWEREQVINVVLACRNAVHPGFALACARGTVALGSATHNMSFERTTMRGTRSALTPRAAQLDR
jgi:hypothetical protein